MKNLSDKEKIIQFFIEKYDAKDYAFSNQFSINYAEIENLNISIQDASAILLELQNDNMLSIEHKDPDFNVANLVVLNSKLLHYFDEIKNDNKSNRREFVRTYFPIIISSFSAIISLIALIISIMR